jgi:hypothetical protein
MKTVSMKQYYGSDRFDNLSIPNTNIKYNQVLFFSESS